MLTLAIGALIQPSFVLLHSRSDTQHAQEDGFLPAGQEWPFSNGDWGNTRYSTLSQINTGNVKDLRGAWISQKFEDGALSRSTPVVKDGLLFVTAGARIYAINAKTGETVWRYRTDTRKPVSSMQAGRDMAAVQAAGQGLPNSQGVAVGDGKVFVGMTDGRVIALGEKTGELLWSRRTGDDPPRRGESVSGAPLYARGLVFAGLADGDFALRGRVVALNAKTGQEAWHFFTVPGPGETGHDTWPQDNDVWKQGGGGVWLPGTVDSDLGMVFFAVGNPVPQTGGELRGGDNLFTSSVIALDMETGKLRWYYQLIRHDIWDADLATAPVLYTAKAGGQSRKALAALRPDGYLFLLDRKTGKPLIHVEDKSVPQDRLAKTAATQPFPVEGESILPECSEWKDKIPPGFVLGCPFTPFSVKNANVLATMFSVRLSPVSYSPQTGYFYAQGSAGLVGRRRVSEDPWFFTTASSQGIAVLNLPSRAFFAAIDSHTDKIVWKKEVPAHTLGRTGFITTAGGLLFRGGDDGILEGYDAKTGELLWQFRIGFPTGPASTYEIDGEQYIAMAAGDSVWAFKLGGAIQPLQANPRLATSPAGSGAGVVVDTDHIEIASLLRDMGLNGGQRYAVDEHTFNPTRARVSAGTRVTWLNNGRIAHTIVAQDKSWSTGTLQAAREFSMQFEKPGTYTYICQQHPWAIGQLIVVPNPISTANASTPSGAVASLYTVEQARRGQTQYSQSCSGCHTSNLSGTALAPPLVGQTFWLRWEGRSLANLLAKIGTMPPDNPGGLNQESYLDIAAFLLQANDIPAGQEELKNTSEALQRTMTK